MKIANEDIKSTAKLNSIKLWQIAEALGMTDATFSRKLRHELPEDKKIKIYEIIDELKGSER